ncbi:hypothetical protein B0T21DRAFT_343560 [Apiosordaria backusii]|uniref:Uncharacterized protein n=1 Tax=Apiosordaria backusii TaxID=314023 RepID=A0AA40EYE2_9PEZI|nr:hypothetical protein B0T21DRAFT_343560 [Apiosordaria backusii]
MAKMCPVSIEGWSWREAWCDVDKDRVVGSYLRKLTLHSSKGYKRYAFLITRLEVYFIRRSLSLIGLLKGIALAIGNSNYLINYLTTTYLPISYFRTDLIRFNGFKYSVKPAAGRTLIDAFNLSQLQNYYEFREPDCRRERDGGGIRTGGFGIGQIDDLQVGDDLEDDGEYQEYGKPALLSRLPFLKEAVLDPIIQFFLSMQSIKKTWILISGIPAHGNNSPTGKVLDHQFYRHDNALYCGKARSQAERIRIPFE